MGQAQNKFMRMRGARSGHDVGAAGLGFAIGDVVGNRAEEQKWLLQDQADVAAKIADRVGAYIHTIDQNRALGHIIKTANQIHQSAFA